MSMQGCALSRRRRTKEHVTCGQRVAVCNGTSGVCKMTEYILIVYN